MTPAFYKRVTLAGCGTAIRRIPSQTAISVRAIRSSPDSATFSGSSSENHILSEPLGSLLRLSGAERESRKHGEPSASKERLRPTMTRRSSNRWTLARTAMLGGLAMTVRTEGGTG
jgi:hypothetical protein